MTLGPRKIHCKILKMSPRLILLFQRPFLRGLFLKGPVCGGVIYGGEFALQNQLGLYLEGNLYLKIDEASL